MAFRNKTGRGSFVKSFSSLYFLLLFTMKVLLTLCLLFLGSALAIRSQWTQLGRADPQDSITIRFALTQDNVDVLEL